MNYLFALMMIFGKMSQEEMTTQQIDKKNRKEFGKEGKRQF